MFVIFLTTSDQWRDFFVPAYRNITTFLTLVLGCLEAFTKCHDTRLQSIWQY